MKLPDFILSIVDMPNEELNEILSYFKKETFAKGHKIINQGKICKKLYFIEKGLARSFYYNDNGKEITAWFFDEGGFMTSAESFFQKSPSFYETELLEDSTLYAITNSELEKLFQKYHAMERFGRLLSVQLLSDVLDNLNALKFKIAKERYDFMINKFPTISYRVPLGDMASYLGITQETLSRIRAKS